MRPIAPVLLALSLFGSPSAPAWAGGPQTTARLLAEADALKERPVAERIAAYRAVLRARKRYDVNAFRALRKLAKLFERQGDPHAQAALATCSSVRHPKNERGTYLARIRLARGLRKEGDLTAAHVVLRSVVERGHRVAPLAVAQALGYLGQDAFDRGDESAVRVALQRGESLDVDPVTQMRLCGWLGLLTLRRGDRKAAVRLQLRCWRLYEQTQDADPRLARKAARTWLDLPLRKALLTKE